MDVRELTEKLRAIVQHQRESGPGGFDEETDHVQADSLLLEFINDPEVSEAFDLVKKWYS